MQDASPSFVFFLRPRTCFQIPSIPAAIMVRQRGPPPRSSVGLLIGLNAPMDLLLFGGSIPRLGPPFNLIHRFPSSPSEVWCSSPEGDRSSQRTGEALAMCVYTGGGSGRQGLGCAGAGGISQITASLKQGLPVSPGDSPWACVTWGPG